jgi:hypothetical protein
MPPAGVPPLLAFRSITLAKRGVLTPELRYNVGRALVYTLTVAQDHTFWGESGFSRGDHAYFVGTARVMVHNANGPCGTIADALAQATAKYANLSENEINKQIIGPQQVRELRAFFGRSVTGSQASAAKFT